MNDNLEPVEIMLDLETLGTRAGCQLLSIGAVAFRLNANGVEIVDSIYMPIAADIEGINTPQKDMGLTRDDKTVAWWGRQSAEARKVFDDPDALNILLALDAFKQWYGLHEVRRLWAHGASFDFPILEAVFVAADDSFRVPFTLMRDTRTIYDLAGIDPKLYRSAKHHNALADCFDQITALHAAWAALKLHRTTCVLEDQRREELIYAEAST